MNALSSIFPSRDAQLRLIGRPLALTPNAAEAISALAPILMDDLASAPSSLAVANRIATIAIHGELVNRTSWLSERLGLTSYSRLQASIRAAGRDPGIDGVLLDFDLPGGEVAGAPETATAIRDLASVKPVVAHVNSLAGSAAYVLAAAASKIVVMSSASVGSIGIVWLHLDRTAQMEKAGVKHTLIFAGRHKVDGSSLQPLDPEARKRIQGQVDWAYNLLVESIGAHRPQLGAAGARKTEAALFMGDEAVEAKLADKVGRRDVALELLKSAPPGNAALPALTARPARLLSPVSVSETKSSPAQLSALASGAARALSSLPEGIPSMPASVATPRPSRAAQVAEVHLSSINESRKRCGLAPLSAAELAHEFSDLDRTPPPTAPRQTRRDAANLTGGAGARSDPIGAR